MRTLMFVTAICLVPLSIGVTQEEKKESPKVCPTKGKCVKEGIMCIQSVAHTSTHNSECLTCKARVPAGKCLKRNYCESCATKAGICGGCGLALTEKGEGEKGEGREGKGEGRGEKGEGRGEKGEGGKEKGEKGDKEIEEALKQLEGDDAEAVGKGTRALIDLAKRKKDAVETAVEKRKDRADVKCDLPKEEEMAKRCRKVLEELRWINEGKHTDDACCEKNAHIKPITTCGRCGKGTTGDGHKLCHACATEFKICYHCWKSRE